MEGGNQFLGSVAFIAAISLGSVCSSGGVCNPASTALGHRLSLGAKIFDMPMDLLLWYL